jgi:hypothetical protein
VQEGGLVTDASTPSSSAAAEPPAAYSIPDPDSRWRCGHCGNLTRFDVQRSRVVAEYWHFSMAGEPAVEETQVRAEVVERVTCRWCGASDRITIVPRPTGEPGAPGADAAEEGLGGTP